MEGSKAVYSKFYLSKKGRYDMKKKLTRAGKLILIISIFTTLAGCGSQEKIKNTKECDDNWAICSLSLNNSESIPKKKSVKVAVLDTGINDDLKELRGYVVKKFNTFNNSSKTIPKNVHGTMIASIIASTSYKNTKIGINKNVQLYDVQVLDDQANGKVKNTVQGIEWAIAEDVDIINMSYGFSHNDSTLKNAIKRATDEGIIVIAATGHTVGLSTDYPAKYPDVISVSAIDKDMNIFSYAGKGKVDYVAPGVDVPVLNMDGDVELQSGTSFSTAYATGIVSLLTPVQKKEDLIIELNQKSIELGPANTFGKGLIQFKEDNNR